MPRWANSLRLETGLINATKMKRAEPRCLHRDQVEGEGRRDDVEGRREAANVGSALNSKTRRGAGAQSR